MYFDKVDKVYYETISVEADAFVIKGNLASGFPNLEDNGITVLDIHNKVKKSLSEKGYEWDGTHDYVNGAMTRGQCCVINEGFKDKNGNVLTVDTAVGCRGDYFGITYSTYNFSPDVIQQITNDVTDVTVSVLQEFCKENHRKTDEYLHFAVFEEINDVLQSKDVFVDFNKLKKSTEKPVVNLSPNYNRGKTNVILNK